MIPAVHWIECDDRETIFAVGGVVPLPGGAFNALIAETKSIQHDWEFFG